MAFLDPTGARGYRWMLLCALMLCGWAINWYGFALGIVLPSISEDLGLRSSQEGWLSSSFFLGSFLFTIPLTNLLSRFPPVKLMTVTFVAATALLFASAYIPSYPVQLGLRFAIASIFVAVNPARTLITQTWFRDHEYAHASGVFNGMYGIVEVSAFWLTAPLLTLFGGWQALYFFFGVFSLVSTVVWILLARERAVPRHHSEQNAAGEGRSPLRVILRRDVWYMGLAGFGGGGAWAAYITFWPTFAQDNYGVSETVAGLILGCTSIGIIPGSFFSAKLLSAVGSRRLFVGAFALAQVPTFALMLVTANVPFLVAVGLIQGLTWAYFPVIMAAPLQIAGISPRQVAVASAFVMVVNMGGVTFGPAVTGVLGEFMDLRAALFGMALLPLISVVGAILMGEPAKGPPRLEIPPDSFPAGAVAGG